MLCCYKVGIRRQLICFSKCPTSLSSIHHLIKTTLENPMTDQHVSLQNKSFFLSGFEGKRGGGWFLELVDYLCWFILGIASRKKTSIMILFKNSVEEERAFDVQHELLQVKEMTASSHIHVGFFRHTERSLSWLAHLCGIPTQKKENQCPCELLLPTVNYFTLFFIFIFTMWMRTGEDKGDFNWTVTGRHNYWRESKEKGGYQSIDFKSLPWIHSFFLFASFLSSDLERWREFLL